MYTYAQRINGTRVLAVGAIHAGLSRLIIGTFFMCELKNRWLEGALQAGNVT